MLKRAKAAHLIKATRGGTRMRCCNRGDDTTKDSRVPMREMQDVIASVWRRLDGSLSIFKPKGLTPWSAVKQ